MDFNDKFAALVTEYGDDYDGDNGKFLDIEGLVKDCDIDMIDVDDEGIVAFYVQDEDDCLFVNDFEDDYLENLYCELMKIFSEDDDDEEVAGFEKIGKKKKLED